MTVAVVVVVVTISYLQYGIECIWRASRLDLNIPEGLKVAHVGIEPSSKSEEIGPCTIIHYHSETIATG